MRTRLVKPSDVPVQVQICGRGTKLVHLFIALAFTELQYNLFIALFKSNAYSIVVFSTIIILQVSSLHESHNAMMVLITHLHFIIRPCYGHFFLRVCVNACVRVCMCVYVYVCACVHV